MGIDLAVGLKGLVLAGEHLHPGVGHGASGGHAEDPVREGAGRALAPADVGGPGAGDGGVRPLGPAGAELQHRAALRRPDDAVCLGGDEALVVQAQQGEGLDELGLDGRGPDRQDRLPGEDGRPLGDGPDVAGELEMPQVVQKFLGEKPLAPEVPDVLLGEVEVLHIVDELVQTRADGEAAVVRHVPEEDVKIGDPVLIPGLQIAVAHGELVEIAEKTQVQLFLFHKTPQLIQPGAYPRPCSAGGTGAVRPPDSIFYYRGRTGE